MPKITLRSLPNAESAVQWRKDRGLLKNSMNCPKCQWFLPNVEIGLDCSHGRGAIRKNVGKKKSLRLMDPFFVNCHLSMEKALVVLYGFIWAYSYDQIKHEATEGDPTDISKDTIAAWTKFAREMVVDYYFKIQSDKGQIGEPGKVVQTDESVFGHHKYERGRILNGNWVLGMINVGSDEVRMIFVEKRDAATLIPAIKSHVLPGTIIHTDGWLAYRSLENEGFTHRVVNHSDPENRFVAGDGTYTQLIKSTWRPMKNFF